MELEQVRGRTVVTRAIARTPLKLLMPRGSGRSAWIVTSTYGGGLLNGDAIDIQLRAAAGTICFFGTQASTKVYPADGLGCRQNLDASIGKNAMLVVMPDPITCYRGAIYEQRQRINLAAGASLMLLDWFTSGRAARGERWAMQRYGSRTDVSIDGQRAFADSILLDAADGPIASPARMGRVDCVAMLVLIGDNVKSHGNAMAEWVARQPVNNGPLIFSASPLVDGALIRVAGPSVESVGRWIRDRFGFIVDLLGEDPWTRKY